MGVDLESLSEATSGAIGSLLSTTILYPLDTCKTKYQAEVRAHGQRKYRLTHLSLFFRAFLLVFLRFVILCMHYCLVIMILWSYQFDRFKFMSFMLLMCNIRRLLNMGMRY